MAEVKKLAEEIVGLTLMEASELTTILKEEYLKKQKSLLKVPLSLLKKA